MAKAKTVYCCSECGSETANWAGKCPSCGAWNSLKELRLEPNRKGSVSYTERDGTAHRPQRMKDLKTDSELRFSTGISELDRVLGGGAVCGSLVLVGGSPGIGKSTLLLQMCGLMPSQRNILYVTGEESERQIKMRADRLKVANDNLFVFAETDSVHDHQHHRALAPLHPCGFRQFFYH